MHSTNAVTRSHTDSGLQNMPCVLISHRGLAEGILVSLIAHHCNVAGPGQLLPVELASSCANTLDSFFQALRRLSIIFHF